MCSSGRTLKQLAGGHTRGQSVEDYLERVLAGGHTRGQTVEIHLEAGLYNVQGIGQRG